MEWSAAEECGAHSLERVGDRDQPRNGLQVWRQNRDRIHHAAYQPGESEQNPFGGIAAREKQNVAGGKNAQTGKGENGSEQNEDCASPIRRARRESKQQNSPPEVHEGPQRSQHKRINRGTDQHHGKRGLRHQQRLDRAILAGLLESLIEGIERHAEIIEEREADEHKGKIALPSRQSARQRGASDETGKIVKRGDAEEGLENLQKESAAITASNPEVTAKKGVELSERAANVPPAVPAGEGRGARRSSACSRCAAPVFAHRLRGVSQARTRPSASKTTRVAISSTSLRVCDANSRVVPRRPIISVFRKRRNSAAASGSRLRGGSSRSRAEGAWRSARASPSRCSIPVE